MCKKYSACNLCYKHGDFREISGSYGGEYEGESFLWCRVV
jgi:hypothetical protein